MIENLLIYHPFGLSTDASQHLEELYKGDCLLQSTFNYKAGGGSEKCIITDKICTKYLDDFRMSDDETNVIVPHLEQLDQQSLQFKITLLFVEKLLSPEGGSFVYTSVNLSSIWKDLDMLPKLFRGTLMVI